MDANSENKKVKKKAEEEFLHIIDVDKILCETGLDLDGLCKLVKLDSQSAVKNSDGRRVVVRRKRCLAKHAKQP